MSIGDWWTTTKLIAVAIWEFLILQKKPFNADGENQVKKNFPDKEPDNYDRSTSRS
jgi:hypothetical protein